MYMRLVRLLQKSSINSVSPRDSIVSSSSSVKRISLSPPPSSTSPNNPSGQGLSSFKSKPTLAQEIYDEFLVCKICLDAYKNPKCLECLHTFCEHCIESHVQSESTYKKYSDYREYLPFGFGFSFTLAFSFTRYG